MSNKPNWVLVGISVGILLTLFALFLFFGAGLQPDNVTSRVFENQESDSSRIIKVQTREEGIYQLRSTDLRRAGFEAGLDSGGIHLLTQGVEVPFWVDDASRETRLSFYAWKSDNLYLDGNVYWLVQGEIPDALRTTDGEGIENKGALRAGLGISEPPAGAYMHHLQIEENNQYFPQATEGDHWFAFTLAAPGKREVLFEADNIAAGNDAQAEIRLTLWASSEAREDPDHRMLVSLNGKPLADESWDGRGLHVVKSRFPSNYLDAGQNLLSLEAPGGENFRVDIVNLDRIEIDYPRYPDPNDENVSFEAPENADDVIGFKPGLRVFDVTDRIMPVELGSVSEDGRLPVGTVSQRKLLLVGESGVLTPSNITPVQDLTGLRDVNSAADYVVAAPSEFLPLLEPLMEYRLSEGLQPFAADLEEIYNQFNYGIPDPIAVNKFIRYSTQKWEFPPQYLLLVGDATYDPRGNIAPPEANRLPTFLVQTVYGGQTATDVGFVQLNDDPWPDLPVGRVPAQNPEQVAAFVQKTLAYEMSADDRANGLDVFAVADGQDPQFKRDAEEFINLFPVDFRVNLFSPPAGDERGADSILDGFQSGAGIVAYFGHGSLDTWGKDRLFGVENVKDLEPVSGMTPVVLNFTCLTGLFTHPTNESLAEALLFASSDRGGAAVLAPSSLTLPTDQSFLSRPLIETLLENPDMRLGDAHLVARRQVPLESPTSRDVMYTFMLFGDPALKVHLSQK